MTRAEIERYVRQLPANARYFDHLVSGIGSSRQKEINRIAAALKDPAFGWHFIKTFTDQNLNPPGGLVEESLMAAYRFERQKARDPELQRTLQLADPSAFFQFFIKAFLLDEEYSFDRIAERLTLPPRVIQLYHDLFWNVRDRLDDEEYLNHLVWPDGRTVMYRDGYSDIHAGMLVLQTAHRFGAEEAARTHGLDRNVMASRDLRSSLANLERSVIVEGELAITAGFAGQRNIAASAARQIIQAGKQGGQETDAQDAIGFQALGDVIISDINRIAPEIIQKKAQGVALTEENKKILSTTSKT